MASDLNPWAVVIGGAITLMGSFGGTWWSNRIQQAAKAEQLARALCGELTAISHVIRARNYATTIRALAAEVLDKQEVRCFLVEVREEYRTIYKENASNIGLLKANLPEDVAIVYTQIASVLEEFATQLDAHRSNRLNVIMPTIAKSHSRLITLADGIDDTLRRGDEVIATIRRFYSRK